MDRAWVDAGAIIVVGLADQPWGDARNPIQSRPEGPYRYNHSQSA